MTVTTSPHLITLFHAKLNATDTRNKTVATALHVQQSHVSEWKRGMRPIPTHHLISLCRLFHCAPRELVGWTHAEESGG